MTSQYNDTQVNVSMTRPENICDIEFMVDIHGVSRNNLEMCFS